MSVQSPTAKPAPAGYSRLQIALHWVAFLLIAQQFVLHDAMSTAWDTVTKGGTAGFDPLVLGHVAGGGFILGIAVWRLWLRASRGVPAPVDTPQTTTSRAQARLAKGVHAGLYAVMILLPISGSVAWFGGVTAAAQGHNLFKVALLGLVGLHVAGALYHQFFLRDGTLARMRRAQE